MSNAKYLVWVTAAAALLLACADEGTTPTPNTTSIGTWEVHTPPYAGAWTHCDLQSDGTLWATIIRDGSKRAAIVRHGEGGWSIQEFEAETTEALNDIRMFDDDRGWAVGNAGALLEYRGGRWFLERPLYNVEYFHLGGVDSHNVWVNGISRPYNGPALLHNDGSGWHEAVQPPGYSSYGPLYMSGPLDGYMIGRTRFGDEILRLGNAGWEAAITFSEPLHFYDIGGAGEVTYAVGERRLGPMREGRVYQITPAVVDLTPAVLPAEDYDYRACFVDARGGLWVAAAPYRITTEPFELLYWNGAEWRRATIENTTSAIPRFFDLDFAAGAGWAVGGAAYARYREP
ncbi:MAG: hypothetical protein JSU81_07890 [Candidatus Coatesbacteria bacterium]|nr:MAG: hypothetical protein JSU81_07890 [Candidatus Coatesbacteria bacterium]